MTSVLEAIIKLPRYKILASNGDDYKLQQQDRLDQHHASHRRYPERNKQSYYDKQYYQRNRLKILAKKKAYSEQPHVKHHNSEYHHHLLFNP